MYNPQIGRWNGADPLDEFASPYVGMGTNPANLIDPSGGGIVGDMLIGAAAGGIIGALTTKNGGNAFKNFTIGAAIGALAGAGFYAATNIDWNAVGHAMGDAGKWMVNKVGSFDFGGVATSILDAKMHGGVYLSADAAAIGWGRHYYNVTAHRDNNAEWSSIIYSIEQKGKTYYSFTTGVRFHKDDLVDGKPIDPGISSPGANSALHKLPTGAKRVAHIHSHLPKLDVFGGQNENFSGADNTQHSSPMHKIKLDFYLVNFQGYLKVYRDDNGVVYPLGHGFNSKFDMNYEEKNNFRGPLSSNRDLEPINIGFYPGNTFGSRKKRN